MNRLKNEPLPPEDIGSALNYYSMECTADDSKAFFIEYLSQFDTELASSLDKVKASFFTNIGFLCRMLSRGFIIDGYTHDVIVGKAKSLLTHIEERESAPPRKRIFVEDAITFFDFLIDSAMQTKAPITRFNYHRSLTRAERDEITAMCDHIMDDISSNGAAYNADTAKVLKQSITNIKKTIGSTVRTRKAVTKKKIDVTKKVKYDHSSTLTPKDVLDKREVFLYDTEHRVIKHIVSDTGLSFSGTSLINVNMDKSSSRVVRKPEEFLGSLTGTFAAIVVKYDSLTTVKKQLTSTRLNDSTVILKVM